MAGLLSAFKSPTWVERGYVIEKCLAREHKAMNQPELETRLPASTEFSTLLTIKVGTHYGTSRRDLSQGLASGTSLLVCIGILH